jgi:PKD repeat protein
MVAFAIASRTVRSTTDMHPLDYPFALAISGDGAHILGYFSCCQETLGRLFDFDTTANTTTRFFEIDRAGISVDNRDLLAIAPGPTASFADAAGTEGVPVIFDAGSSSNAGGRVTGYTWEFADGTPAVTTTTPTISHTFAYGGSHRVKLTTTNEGGCATRFIYTGKTAVCTGSPTATTTRVLDIPGRAAAHTRGAGAVGATSATLNGLIVTGGLGGSWHFEYGPTTSYGRRTATQSLPARWGDLPVQARVTGLPSNRRYHYRLVVETPDRPSSLGEAATFKTTTNGSLTLTSKRLTVKGKRARVRLRCASTAACRGRITLTIRKGRTTCGRAKVRLAAKRAATLRVPVGRSCRTRLSKRPAGRLKSELSSGQKNLSAPVRLKRR